MKIIFDLYQDHIAHLQNITAQILETSRYSSLLIHSGTEKNIYLDDQQYPFKANFFFLYWLPENLKDAFILVDGIKTPELLILEEENIWTKNQNIYETIFANQFNIKKIYNINELANNKINNALFLGEDTELAAELNITSCNDPKIIKKLNYHRAIKTPYEIECIKQANKIACIGHKLIKELINNTEESEFSLHNKYLAATKHEQQDLPYSTIIAHNENGAVLHYQHKQKTAPNELKSLLIDAGASYNYYAADISRTYCYNQQDLFNEIIKATDAAQLELTQHAISGCSWQALNQKANLKIANILQEFKITTHTTEDLIENNLTKHFFPHNLGHLLGLQTHDTGSKEHGSSVNGKPELILKENMIVTIEPGIYFILPLLQKLKDSKYKAKFNWDLIAKLTPYGGVRIEDNIHVGIDAATNLSRNNGL